jgi:SAM-dependent methyltransferase
LTASHSDGASTRWLQDELFNAAWAYDLAFSWDVSREVDVLSLIADLRPGARVLMPACGTGRLACAFARRGSLVEASDINPRMLAFARARRGHPSVSYELADMTRSLGHTRSDCDVAFTLCNSFRYILDDAEIAAHLRAVWCRLKPGARYVIELALNEHDPRLIGMQNRWTAQREGYEITATWTIVAFTPPTALEVGEILIEDADGNIQRVREEQPQRLWTWGELVRLASAHGFEIAGVHTVEGAIAAEPTLPARYYVCLRRPGGTTT